MAAIIGQIKNKGVICYPITKPEAVIDDNGNTILDIIENTLGVDLSGYLTRNEFIEQSNNFATLASLETLSKKINEKVDSTYVNNAIGEAIINELNSDF